MIPAAAWLAADIVAGLVLARTTCAIEISEAILSRVESDNETAVLDAHIDGVARAMRDDDPVRAVGLVESILVELNVTS
jgi:hypothetical protein